MDFCFILKRKITMFYLLSFAVVVSLAVIRCHSLLFVVTGCHSLSLVVTRCHSLSLDVPVACLFINDLTGWLYSVCMRNISYKKSPIFEGYHVLRFYILILSSFRITETKNFNWDAYLFNLVKLGTISRAAYFLNCVHIRR